MAEIKLGPKLSTELDLSSLKTSSDDILPSYSSSCQSSKHTVGISPPEIDRESVGILPTEIDILSLEIKESLENPQDFDRESLETLLETLTKPTQDFGKEFSTVFSTDFGNRSLGIPLEDFDRESFRFTSTDFGKESLGILPADFGKESEILPLDWGKKSLGIPSLDFGKESLGILPPDFGKESLGMSSIDFGTESLGILPMDLGRESLGILPPDFAKYLSNSMNRSMQDENFSARDSLKFRSVIYKSGCEKGSQNCNIDLIGTSQINQADSIFADMTFLKSEINISKIGCSLEDTYTNPLDLGFFNPNSQNSPNLSFNSCSLNGPSKIYFLAKSDSLKSSNYSTQSNLNNAVLMNTTNYENMQRRIQSMPSPIHSNLGVQPQNVFWGMSKSFHGELDINGKDNLCDSVFVEGNCATNKITDVSIFDAYYAVDLSQSWLPIIRDEITPAFENNDTNILDCTPQPVWPDELDDSSEKEVPIVSTEAVFKKINNIFPVDQNKIDIRLKTKNESKPKDAKEMLENLSEMWNSKHLSDSQKLEGQNLITSLAELLCKKCNIANVSDTNLNTEDSGHSSIIEQHVSSKKENHQCYEILDLRKNSLDISKISESCDKPLDLSLKTKYSRSQSVSTQSCLSRLSDNKKLHSSLKNLANNVTSVSKNASIKNKETSSNFIQPKFPAKIKSKTTVATKKGPLKAIIPMTEMKSKSTLATGVTPTKVDQRLSKRTSTPIREAKLKPMAASTPILETLNQPKEIKSPAARTRKSLQSSSTDVVSSSPANVSKVKTLNEISVRTSLSGISVPKYSANSSFPSKFPRIELKRRNSVHETKSDNILKVKRSNSIGLTGLMTSLSKVRENLKSSPYFDNEKKNVLDNGNLKSLPKMKILGKENILK